MILAQQQPSETDKTSGETRGPKIKKAAVAETTKEAPKLSEEQKLAYSTLEVSESTSRGFEAPMRSYGLLQIGSTFVTLDANKARELLRDAFTASLEIHDDDYDKARLQQEVLSTLLPLSQADVEELLPQAEISARKPTTEAIVNRYAQKKEFDKALDLINQLTSADEFPYGSGSRLMDAMPAEMAAEKQTLFTQAVASYKGHEHPGLMIGPDTLTAMIIHFAPSMPPKLILQGIDEILDETKAKAQDQNSNIMLMGQTSSISFTSAYQYQLFALLPVLQKLDPDRAKDLLDQNQSLQAQMQQYPQGTESIMPLSPQTKPAQGGSPAATSTHISYSINNGKPGAGGKGGPMPGMTASPAQDLLRRDAQAKLESISQEAETDPVQAMAHSMTLPLQLDGPGGANSPRADALERIARANVKKNTGAAEAAITELRKVVVDLPAKTQVQYLSSAGNLYLQMDDKDKAAKVVDEGFKVAEKLLELDTNPDSPNEALKAWWPSSDAYRHFVEIETKISDRATLNVLKEIKDPEIRTTESIMFARTLLGLPLKRFTVVEKRGNSTSSRSTDTN
jgi:tetratricopeptide (TPR) repeat protein